MTQRVGEIARPGGDRTRHLPRISPTLKLLRMHVCNRWGRWGRYFPFLYVRRFSLYSMPRNRRFWAYWRKSVYPGIGEPGSISPISPSRHKAMSLRWIAWGRCGGDSFPASPPAPHLPRWVGRAVWENIQNHIHSVHGDGGNGGASFALGHPPGLGCGRAGSA